MLLHFLELKADDVSTLLDTRSQTAIVERHKICGLRLHDAEIISGNNNANSSPLFRLIGS
jgi:hypothetical protein